MCLNVVFFQPRSLLFFCLRFLLLVLLFVSISRLEAAADLSISEARQSSLLVQLTAHMLCLAPPRSQQSSLNLKFKMQDPGELKSQIIRAAPSQKLHTVASTVSTVLEQSKTSRDGQGSGNMHAYMREEVGSEKVCLGVGYSCILWHIFSDFAFRKLTGYHSRI